MMFQFWVPQLKTVRTVYRIPHLYSVRDGEFLNFRFLVLNGAHGANSNSNSVPGYFGTVARNFLGVGL